MAWHGWLISALCTAGWWVLIGAGGAKMASFTCTGNQREWREQQGTELPLFLSLHDLSSFNNLAHTFQHGGWILRGQKLNLRSLLRCRSRSYMASLQLHCTGQREPWGQPRFKEMRIVSTSWWEEWHVCQGWIQLWEAISASNLPQGGNWVVEVAGSCYPDYNFLSYQESITRCSLWDSVLRWNAELDQGVNSLAINPHYKPTTCIKVKN